MGLFDKIGGKGGSEKKEKPAKQPKQKASKKEKPKKGGLFAGKKKEMSLLERMQLEESVAAASLDVVLELAELGQSAVRETDEGLLIIALTNDTLEAAGLDPASEEFGSFAEALRSETVESIALAEDLADGVVGIIPSTETLISLDEFDFAHDVAFKWAIVPFDLEDEDRLTLLDSEVHIDRLVEMSNDNTIEAHIDNGIVVLSGGAVDEFDDVEADTSDDFDYDGSGITETEASPADDGFDFDDEDEDDDTLTDDAPAVDGFDVDDDDLLDDDDDDELDADYSAPAVVEVDDDLGLDDDTEDDVEEETLSAEESKEIINRVASHAFNNTELGLDINMTLFDDIFNSVNIAEFDTSYQDGSELQKVISKLRQDANIELKRFHQDNIQNLRTKYASNISDIHNKLVEALDHRDRKTTYGVKYIEIENEYDEAMGDIDRETANRIVNIREAYDEDREDFGENAKREAFSIYDTRYRDKRDNDIANVSENLQVDLKLARDTDLGEMYKDRRQVAKRLFDKAVTTLLQKIQDDHQEISRKELQMYDAFRKDMDVYLRKHFADDVLRSKAQAESLRQTHEAERVRNEYEQMLTTKARQLEELESESRDKLRQLESTHDDQVSQVKADYEHRIEREQRDNLQLRELLADANESTSKIGDQKDKEIQHTLNLYKNTIESKDLELKYANDRLTKSQKPLYFIMAAIGAVMLALGIIFGFLFGAGQSAAPEQPQPPTEQYGFADDIDYGVPAGVINIVDLFTNETVSANADAITAGGYVAGAASYVFTDQSHNFIADKDAA